MYKKLFSPVILILIMITVLAFYNFPQGESKNSGFNVENLNKSVSPAQDFYEFAVGSWIKNHPIPDEYSRYGSFEVLQEENNKVLKSILEEASQNKNWAKGSAQQKIGDFYATGIDSARIEKQGYNPIKSFLKSIDGIDNKKELIKTISEFHLGGADPLFNFFASIDAKKSELMVARIWQGGVGLPDVEYYTKDDARSKEIRDKYAQHVTNMFKLIDVDDAAAANYAKTVMEIETKLAQASNTRLENRDPIKTYNKMTIGGLKSVSGGFDWDLYFEGLGIEKPLVAVVSQPKFITAMANLISEVSLDDWKIYLKWNLIDNYAEALSSEFVNEDFDFNDKFLNGQVIIRPRWKRILSNANSAMGELLGQIYVSKVFPPEAKERAVKIVNTLLVSMGESIKNLEWMSSDTKQQALKKLSTFGVKIGYPDKWKDYSDLEVSRVSYFQNLWNASVWAAKDNLNKIGKLADKSEWSMTPQTVNAMYSSTRNDITFPAAILQQPFFNQYADDAINYGAMGAVIGHEITHGFDDQGRKYDENGNLRDWWTQEDNDKFQARAKKLIDEYNNFAVIDTFRVDGALTLGENIADLGGLTISFNAYKNTDEFKKNEKIDGLAPAQRFFLGWAQVWANNIRQEALKLRLKTDVHSPGKQRVIGPLMNMPEFFSAYDVKPGDPMRNPDDKIVKIW